MADFSWDTQKEDAAQLIADGELTYRAIAERVGAHYNTITRWMNEPEFSARVDAILDEFRRHIRRRGLAVVERRVESVNDRWRRLQTVVEERAANPEMVGIPGGTTGMIVRNLKGIGKGDDFQVVETYEVDTGLLRSMLDLERQAAQELGQWTERQHVETRDLTAAEAFDRRMAGFADRVEAGGVSGESDPGR
jgi:ParB-like chromosome segregation protein Spo0J